MFQGIKQSNENASRKKTQRLVKTDNIMAKPEAQDIHKA